MGCTSGTRATALSFLLVVASALLLAESGRRTLALEEPRRRVECEVRLGLARGVYVAWITKDQALIDEYVLSPLDQSVIDPDPARYAGYGSIKLTNGDDVRYFDLMNPWGHVQELTEGIEHNEYRIADLSKLQARIEEDLARHSNAVRDFEIAEQIEEPRRVRVSE